MADPEPTADVWQQDLARLVGRRVAYFRNKRKLTAQQLSDELKARLGFDMKRTVIGSLETGARRTVGLAEVLALAYVLDVPPLMLVVPVTAEAEFEVLPGTTMDTWRAARWLSGEARLPAGTGGRRARRDLAMDWTWEALDLYRKHDNAAQRADFVRRLYQRALDDMVRVEYDGPAQDVGESERLARTAELETRSADSELRIMRRVIRDHKWPLPKLELALARRMDDQEGGTDA